MCFHIVVLNRPSEQTECFFCSENMDLDYGLFNEGVTRFIVFALFPVIYNMHSQNKARVFLGKKIMLMHMLTEIRD